LEVVLDGSGTIDVDGAIMSYDWDTNDDGSTDTTGRTANWTFPSEGDYPVTLTVTDNGGASDTYAFTASVGAASVEIPIQIGWNLISLPLDAATSYTAETLCSEIGEHISEIDRWYAGGWDSHVCGLPFNDFEIGVGNGYFARSTSATQWSLAGTVLTGQFILSFSPGWNLVSLPTGTNYAAEELGDEINAQGGSCVEIDRWYAGGWDSHVIDLPFNDFAIEPGTGYFIRCNAGSTFTIAMP
jgi:PKD repeat protein